MDTQALLVAVLVQMVLTLFFLQLLQLAVAGEQTVQLALLVVQEGAQVKLQALQELVDQELQIKVMQEEMAGDHRAEEAEEDQMKLVKLEAYQKLAMVAMV